MKAIAITILFMLTQHQQPMVVICTGRMSYTYHALTNDSCIGLSHCMAQRDTITLDSALKLHRKPCGYCFPKY